MTNRTIWKVLVFTILTLGIYRLYWFIKTRREMMRLDPTIKILSPLYLIIPTILVVLSMGVFLVSTIQASAKIPSYCNTQSNSGAYRTNALPAECTVNQPIWPTIAFYVALLLIGPMIAIWLWGYSKGVEKITKEKTSFPLAMIILLAVPDGIDILLVQDAFNKVSEQQNTESSNSLSAA